MSRSGLIGIIAAAILVTGCNEIQQESVEDYQNHMNSTIALYCDLYRASDEVTRNSIKHELTRMMRNYYGPIDRHSEYCLNAIEVPYNR